MFSICVFFKYDLSLLIANFLVYTRFLNSKSSILVLVILRFIRYSCYNLGRSYFVSIDSLSWDGSVRVIGRALHVCHRTVIYKRWMILEHRGGIVFFMVSGHLIDERMVRGLILRANS